MKKGSSDLPDDDNDDCSFLLSLLGVGGGSGVGLTGSAPFMMSLLFGGVSGGVGTAAACAADRALSVDDCR